jgi:hypothetical protein
MKRLYVFTMLLAAGLLVQVQLPAQGFLKKLADKALEKKVSEKVGVDPNANSNNNNSNAPANENTGRPGKPANKTGEGLKNSAPPDVSQQITDAETAHDAGNFSDARYSIQQALLGVELQIGKKILQSLPATVSSLPYDSADDKVMSARWGWANLTIQRIYQKGDKQLNMTIGNNAMYSSAIDMYYSGMYAQSNGDKQNMKQTKVKGNRALIKFDNNEGYTLIVQLGQSGMITWSAVNFASEQEVMTAANSFDIDGIKKLLGEK